MADSCGNPVDPDVYADVTAARQTIMIVDDDMSLLAMMGEMIEAFGYRSVSVASGAAALREVAKDRIDLIISDINMPGISGIELLKRVKKIMPGIPVFLMSGDRRILVLAAQACRVDGLLSKPFFIEDLSGLIERTLNPLRVVA